MKHTETSQTISATGDQIVYDIEIYFSSANTFLTVRQGKNNIIVSINLNVRCGDRNITSIEMSRGYMVFIITKIVHLVMWMLAYSLTVYYMMRVAQ